MMQETNWKELSAHYSKWSEKLQEVLLDMKLEGMPITPAYGRIFTNAIKMKLEEVQWWLERLGLDCYRQQEEKEQEEDENETK